MPHFSVVSRSQCSPKQIRCVSDPVNQEEPCQGCHKLRVSCTYDYVRKKPGRKSTRGADEASTHPRSFSSSSSYQPDHPELPPHRKGHLPSPYIPSQAPRPRSDTQPSSSSQSPLNDTRHYGRPYSSFVISPQDKNDSIFWLDAMLDTGWLSAADAPDMLGPPEYPSEQAHLLSLESPELVLAAASSSSNLNHLVHPTKREPQLEDVTSWADISHFISLFLQYLYPLLPLVHRPTFSENLATRRDLRDIDFRALLLSIGYLLWSDQSHTNQHYHIVGNPRLAGMWAEDSDTFYLLSIGLSHTAGARLGQAVQLAYCMGIHSDCKTASLGVDAIEAQLRRRVFWQLYASDKTRAIPGPPMLINDFQGTPSLPAPIDDEFITPQGMFPQPPTRTSVLVGFVAISQVFKIISKAFFHHRCIQSEMGSVSPSWIAEAEGNLQRLLEGTPEAISRPELVKEESMKRVFGMQRANILITAAIAKFALFDLRAALDRNENSLRREREDIAREIHSLLMEYVCLSYSVVVRVLHGSIPVEDMASNGESVRGKVFHIACALVSQALPNADQELIRDWCNMFSAITFVQMPPPPDPQVDSRPTSPHRQETPPIASRTSL
ncbi:hypothetical protein TREMEDRAFT_66245 [Tremella mesenterica DSM 1558]|uniref:uncharacterized protein n=1 Tax=Tremella mesenterica (strain ATCC 24925 / CBS 8224 / DSM 1558 / NBRC 9311 / NRRL Y-6157 / RJB 2259-6 / UBC 559-6) TaxID=578456 RepID=UPI00032C4193|nr:uncharacterized protein TREMEDRAFT_66245 [Tremella mesenterica DSM 1558]EIW65878.1 hypothetical protein TREMEDRAFT_66245 [Tremella mesenterica DSM 1558]